MRPPRARTNGNRRRNLRRAVTSRRMRRLVVCLALLALAGCGGERQDADEPRGEFTLEVVEASFPERQSIAERSTLSIEVRNTDDRELPDVSVTIETEPDDRSAAAVAFGQASDDPRLADPDRPVWILDRGPTAAAGSSTNTWSLGPMFPGETKAFRWRLTAVRAGSYRVGYRVSPGLYGKAVPANGQNTTGAFDVTISDEPVPARVGEDGEVVRGGGGSD
jgi:hypothetical protein